MEEEADASRSKPVPSRAILPGVSTQPPSRAEREARRSLLQDALVKLGESDDKERAAFDVMRALDAYIEETPAGPFSASPSREIPVMTGNEPSDRSAKIIAGSLLGAAVVATMVVAVSMNGGWSAGIAVAAIWIATLGLLLSST